MTLCSLIGIWCALAGPARVIDGDTLAIGATHVRLAGIDAEELMEPNGYRAKFGLQEIIAGRQVKCEDTGQRSYGRTVAMCWAWSSKTDLSLNARMVNEGFALDCERYSGGKFRALEPVDIRSKLKQKPYC